ncbi:hypothetical protein FQN57_007524 [Myotisia sp. PD_48]|nr:hypothetical protein FQN57_007524 [Myotisia sp. PD_48]
MDTPPAAPTQNLPANTPPAPAARHVPAYTFVENDIRGTIVRKRTSGQEGLDSLCPSAKKARIHLVLSYNRAKDSCPSPWLEGDGAGESPNTRKGKADIETFMNWKLVSHIWDPSSHLPPQHVQLSDSWVFILTLITTPKTRAYSWPGDFNRDGTIRATRVPRGIPPIAFHNNQQYYITLRDYYTLTGDDGAKHAYWSTSRRQDTTSKEIYWTFGTFPVPKQYQLNNNDILIRIEDGEIKIPLFNTTSLQDRVLYIAPSQTITPSTPRRTVVGDGTEIAPALCFSNVFQNGAQNLNQAETNTCDTSPIISTGTQPNNCNTGPDIRTNTGTQPTTCDTSPSLSTDTCTDTSTQPGTCNTGPGVSTDTSAQPMPMSTCTLGLGTSTNYPKGTNRRDNSRLGDVPYDAPIEYTFVESSPSESSLSEFQPSEFTSRDNTPFGILQRNEQADGQVEEQGDRQPPIANRGLRSKNFVTKQLAIDADPLKMQQAQNDLNLNKYRLLRKKVSQLASEIKGIKPTIGKSREKFEHLYRQRAQQLRWIQTIQRVSNKLAMPSSIFQLIVDYIDTPIEPLTSEEVMNTAIVAELFWDLLSQWNIALNRYATVQGTPDTPKLYFSQGMAAITFLSITSDALCDFFEDLAKADSVELHQILGISPDELAQLIISTVIDEVNFARRSIN